VKKIQTFSFFDFQILKDKIVSVLVPVSSQYSGNKAPVLKEKEEEED
jgi:hypothetical protein